MSYSSRSEEARMIKLRSMAMDVVKDALEVKGLSHMVDKSASTPPQGADGNTFSLAINGVGGPHPDYQSQADRISGELFEAGIRSQIVRDGRVKVEVDVSQPGFQENLQKLAAAAAKESRERTGRLEHAARDLQTVHSR